VLNYSPDKNETTFPWGVTALIAYNVSLHVSVPKQFMYIYVYVYLPTPNFVAIGSHFRKRRLKNKQKTTESGSDGGKGGEGAAVPGGTVQGRHLRGEKLEFWRLHCYVLA